MGVELETQEVDGALRVALSGELDVATAPSVEERLVKLEGNAAPRIVLDLRGLDFIDSSGLSLLLNTDSRARKAGRAVTIVAGHAGGPRRLLETTGLVGRLDVVEAIER